MKQDLTPAQRAVLVVLAEKRSLPWTVREVGATVGIRSTGHIAYVRDSLARQGLVTFQPKIARSLVITRKGKRVLHG